MIEMLIWIIWINVWVELWGRGGSAGLNGLRTGSLP